LPADLATARLALENAIRNADTDPAFQETRVLILDDRLLVVPGLGAGATSGGPVSFLASTSGPVPDEATVYLLGLKDRVGIDVRLGRIAFPWAPLSARSVLTSPTDSAATWVASLRPALGAPAG